MHYCLSLKGSNLVPGIREFAMPFNPPTPSSFSSPPAWSVPGDRPGLFYCSFIRHWVYRYQTISYQNQSRRRENNFRQHQLVSVN